MKLKLVGLNWSSETNSFKEKKETQIDIVDNMCLEGDADNGVAITYPDGSCAFVGRILVKLASEQYSNLYWFSIVQIQTRYVKIVTQIGSTNSNTLTHKDMKRANFKRAKLLRQKGALARLETAFSKFQAGKEDKKSWISSRNCKPHQHTGRSYDSECKRMQQEINKLREKISTAA